MTKVELKKKILRGHAKISRLIYHYQKHAKAVENLSRVMKMWNIPPKTTIGTGKLQMPIAFLLACVIILYLKAGSVSPAELS